MGTAIHRTALPERNLDVLRAVAVLCVLVDHTLGVHDVSLSVMTNWQLGRIGVLLFFVHTSLVLMASLERQRQHGTDGWIRTFYIRRAFRIYPLAIATILIAVLVQIPPHVIGTGPQDPPVVPTATALIGNLLLVQNLVTSAPTIQNVLWSLPLEVQMYLLLPALYLIACWRKSWGVCAAILVAALLGLAVRYSEVPGLWRLSVFTFAPCFVAGVLAFHLARRFAPKLPAWTWPLVLVVAVVIFIACAPDADHPERGWLACLCLGAMIPCVRNLSQSRVTQLAAQIAKYSYGVYLAHLPLLWLWFVVFHAVPSVVQWAGFLASIVLVPIALYHGLEAPAIAWGARVAGRRSTLTIQPAVAKAA